MSEDDDFQSEQAQDFEKSSVSGQVTQSKGDVTQIQGSGNVVNKYNLGLFGNSKIHSNTQNFLQKFLVWIKNVETEQLIWISCITGSLFVLFLFFIVRPRVAENLYQNVFNKIERREYKFAIDDYEKAIAIDSYFKTNTNNKISYAYLNIAYQSFQEKNYSSSQQYAERAKLTSNSNAITRSANRLIAKIYMDRANPSENDFSKAIDLLLNEGSSGICINTEIYRKDLAIDCVGKNSPAMKQGIKTGDLIFKINGIPVSTIDMNSIIYANELLYSGGYGTNIKLELYREEKGTFSETLIKSHFPPLANAYFNRANIYQRQGKHENAVIDYTKSIVVEPRGKIAYLNRAKSRVKLGNLEDALVDFNNAITINIEDMKDSNLNVESRVQIESFHVEALLGRSSLRRNMGDKDGALADAKEAKKICKTNFEVKKKCDLY